MNRTTLTLTLRDVLSYDLYESLTEPCHKHYNNNWWGVTQGINWNNIEVIENRLKEDYNSWNSKL